MKACRVCGETKPESEFYTRRATCKPCVVAHVQSRYWQNPDAKRAYSREHRKTYDQGENRERRLARARERYREQREYEAERSKRYYEANKERWLGYAATRRAQGSGRVPVEIQRKLTASPCAYCGSRENIEIDHIVPLSRGGKHEPENLASSCRSCNRSKGAKLVSEWLGVAA